MSNSSLGNVYRYDQLNRLVDHKVFDNFDNPTNSWQNTGVSGTDAYYENFNYDANGNILNFTRNGNNTGATIGMDNFTYRYDNASFVSITGLSGVSITPAINNKLYHVNDAVNSSNYLDDIDDEGTFNNTQSTLNTANNYGYDEIGNLVRDDAEGIQNIIWNVYGKIQSITRTGNNNKPDLSFGYDATRQRLYKTVKPRTAGILSKQKDWITTWYVRDASGNVMATYSQSYAELLTNQKVKEEIKVKELHLYGSDRLGINNSDLVMASQEYNISGYNGTDKTFINQSVMVNTLITVANPNLPTIYIICKGKKQYELNNHLGNVLATISDRKIAVDANADMIIDYYFADMSSTSNYFAFGSPMPGRSIGQYRYGFNTQEKDNEVSGAGNINTAEFWEYDCRSGRRWNVDPLADEKSWMSSYHAFSDNPVYSIDVYGALDGDYLTKEGIYLGSDELDDKKVYITTQENYNNMTQKWDGSNPNYAGLRESSSLLQNITYEEFTHMAALVNKEEPNREGKFAVANAIKNRWDKWGGTFVSVFNSLGGSASKDLHAKIMKSKPDAKVAYKKYINATKQGRSDDPKMRLSTEATINALIGGYDYSNGATGWQGTDVLPGFVPDSHADEDMVKAGWIWAENAIIGKKARFNQTTFKTTANSKGTYGYNITASYGNGLAWSGTIFTKSN